ncbi:MAG: hypothetical protein KJP23_03465, partial [Deltaproteobacteria bacterium]|nr:hypothetical protein [Deltaproteobacteria bacterium]
MMPQFVEPQPKLIHNPAFSAHPLGKSNTLSFDMSFLQIGPQDGLYYEHLLPADTARATFVFFNALTGDTAAWETVICPILRDAGYGTLTYN